MIYWYLTSTIKRGESQQQKNQRKLLNILYKTKKSLLQLMIYLKQWKLRQINIQKTISKEIM